MPTGRSSPEMWRLAVFAKSSRLIHELAGRRYTHGFPARLHSATVALPRRDVLCHRSRLTLGVRYSSPLALSGRSFFRSILYFIGSPPDSARQQEAARYGFAAREPRRSIQEMKRGHLLTAWLTAGALLGIGADILWMTSLASGLGVEFEIAMLFEEILLFVGGGCLVGFAAFGIHISVLKGRNGLKT